MIFLVKWEKERKDFFGLKKKIFYELTSFEVEETVCSIITCGTPCLMFMEFGREKMYKTKDFAFLRG